MKKLSVLNYFIYNKQSNLNTSKYGLIKNFSERSNPYYDYFLYTFFLKTNWIRVKKTLKKDFYLHNVDYFLKNILKSGNKLKMLKMLNLLNKNVFFLFTHFNDDFSKKFNSYSIFYNFSKSDLNFFNINYLLNILKSLNESVFNLKVVRVSKKLKKKLKTKYSTELTYINKKKRVSVFLKNMHLQSNNYNYYKYDQRLFMSFINSFFLQKDSEIYKNKIKIYNNIIKSSGKF